jgi:voltage-gated potassium channel
MKLFLLQILFFVKNEKAKKNVCLLAKFLFYLALIIAVYSVAFHLLMVHEGKDYSWITGLYWTLTVMSTLGFGDITFSTDLGLIFTLVVLTSGVILLLIMLPFTFIQFFWAPWLEAQKQTRTPRSLPETTKDHVILTNYDPITRNLVQKLKKHKYDYCFVTEDQQTAIEIYDAGYTIVLGEEDNPETYKKIQADKAALIVTTADDLMNTNICFTIREVSDTVPIAASADNKHSLDILNFSGNTNVFQFMNMMGTNMAEKTMIVRQTHIIGEFDKLLIGEFPVRDIDNLAGQTLKQARLRNRIGLTVIGIWERGEILLPDPDAILKPTNILIIAGTKEDLERVDRNLAMSTEEDDSEISILILGGGRVGQAAADYLENHKIPFTIVEKRPTIKKRHNRLIHGDAADINTLKEAGIEKARAVIITTHNDAMNIYLSFYCRQLRSDIQIVTRAAQERTIPKLHRAGADIVDSSASMGANSIMNLLQPSESSFFSEALNVFMVPTPEPFVGKTLAEAMIREQTGCNLLAIKTDKDFTTHLDPDMPFNKTGKLILAGSLEAEGLFRTEYLE